MSDAAAAKSPVHRGHKLITNVLWSWTGVLAGLFQGIVITRLLIKSLDAQHYGTWALIFTILEYFWFFDLGLNTAVTNFCARSIAVKEPARINEVINTSLFYFSIIALCVWSLSPVLAWNAHTFFNIALEDQAEFAALILTVGISWGLCIVLHMFVSALEGFQRFDLTSKVNVIQVALRSIGYFVALKTGHGLVTMAQVFVGTQILGYIINFVNFRRVFPELRLSKEFIRWATFQDILRYGLKSFGANLATMFLNNGGPALVGHYLNQRAVGFFVLPVKLLQQATDAVSRIGLVTRANAAELTATASRDATVSLGIYSNRYSLTLFMPLVCYLLVYGPTVILRWVGAEMADRSGPLLPIFLLSYALVMAAQFNSSALLFGVGRHGRYALALVVEAALYLASLVWVVPRYGIWGAAWVSATLMIAVRGIYTPWLVSRALDYSFWAYMSGIYVRPLLAAAPALAVAFAAKATVLPGRTWSELILAGCLTAGTYLAIAMFTCIAPHHRALFVGRIPLLGPRLVPHRA